jgi:chromosome transmission fidelity protein 4
MFNKIFNDVGYVRQTNTDEENVIDVDFHDNTIHHAFRIKNILEHTMAALCQEALVLGCESQDTTPRYLFRNVITLSSYFLMQI